VTEFYGGRESSISADDSVDRVRSPVVIDSGVGGGHHT